MKRFVAIMMCLCMMLSLAACAPTPEEILAANMKAYEDFKADWNKEPVMAVNARVITDANGDKMLMADIVNNSDSDISEITLSFAAWDAEGNFVIIKSRNNPENAYREFQMDVGDVTVASGETWDANVGIFLADTCPEIAHVEAAVISCTMEESDYLNRLYEAWKQTYLEQHLEDWMKTA